MIYALLLTHLLQQNENSIEQKCSSLWFTAVHKVLKLASGIQQLLNKYLLNGWKIEWMYGHN